jgi:acyl-CoA thioester hydrolase
MQRLTPKGRITETKLRVRYAETDAMGIVHHSAYIPWFELGRSDWLRDAGLPYTEFERMGYYLTVTEVCARYYHPAIYDEIITVRTGGEEVRSRAVTRSYDIRNEQGKRLVMACTKHVCITHDGKPARLPDALYEVLKAQVEKPGD